MEAESVTTYGQTRGFLFADLRGYTDFVERRGDDEAARLLDRYRLMVRGVVARHAGAEVRTEGDSFYVVFPSASQAVVAALDIVAEADKERAAHPEAPIKVGVGVHAGETSDRAEGPVGSAVNIAARICAQAKAGEVLVSETVRGLTRTRQIATFTSAGTKRLKGIAEPMALFRALPPGSTIAVSTGRTGAAFGGRWPLLGAAAAVILALLFGGFLLSARNQPAASGSPGSSSVAGASPSARSSSTPHAEPTGDPTQEAITGTRIIYSRQVAPDGCNGSVLDAKLYVVDPDDTSAEPYRLTDGSNLFEFGPSWSDDGSTVGFIGAAGHDPGNLYAANSDGSIHVANEVRFVGVPSSGVLATAPDGTSIFASDGGLMWLSQSDGSDTVDVTSSGAQARLISRSHSSQAIAFFDTHGITEAVLDATYRADRSLLILARPIDGGTPYLYTMPEEGGTRELLLFDFSGLDATGMALAGDDDGVALVVEGESGSSLEVGSLSEGPSSLVAIDLGVSEVRQPAFSPDGLMIAVQAGPIDDTQIHVVDLETGDSTRLTDDSEASACSPTWSNAPVDLIASRPEPEPGVETSLELGQIRSGPVRNDVVDPPMSLTFSEGWFARRNEVDGWSVLRQDVSDQTVDYAKLQFGYTEACADLDPVAIGTRPDEILEALQARDDLELFEVGPVNLGGYSGITAVIAGKDGTGCPGDDPFWALWVTAENSLRVAQNEVVRLVSLDVDGATRSFLMFGTGEMFSEFWDTEAQPLLDTITFPD